MNWVKTRTTGIYRERRVQENYFRRKMKLIPKITKTTPLPGIYREFEKYKRPNNQFKETDFPQHPQNYNQEAEIIEKRPSKIPQISNSKKKDEILKFYGQTDPVVFSKMQTRKRNVFADIPNSGGLNILTADKVDNFKNIFSVIQSEDFRSHTRRKIYRNCHSLNKRIKDDKSSNMASKRHKNVTNTEYYKINYNLFSQNGDVLCKNERTFKTSQIISTKHKNVGDFELFNSGKKFYPNFSDDVNSQCEKNVNSSVDNFTINTGDSFTVALPKFSSKPRGDIFSGNLITEATEFENLYQSFHVTSSLHSGDSVVVSNQSVTEYDKMRQEYFNKLNKAAPHVSEPMEDVQDNGKNLSIFEPVITSTPNHVNSSHSLSEGEQKGASQGDSPHLVGEHNVTKVNHSGFVRENQTLSVYTENIPFMFEAGNLQEEFNLVKLPNIEACETNLRIDDADLFGTQSDDLCGSIGTNTDSFVCPSCGHNL